MEQLVVFGKGGFGREVMWLIDESNKGAPKYDILGFVDDTVAAQGAVVNGHPVIGTIDFLINYPSAISVVVAVGNSLNRKGIVERLQANRHISFPTVIAVDAIHSNLVQFGEGCIICSSSIITVNVTLGDFVVVNLACTIGHDARISDFVSLAPTVNVSGGVDIGTCTEIGTGSQIIPGKHIGEHTIVGAGSVVVKDIPPRCTAVGTPARPIEVIA